MRDILSMNLMSELYQLHARKQLTRLNSIYIHAYMPQRLG